MGAGLCYRNNALAMTATTAPPPPAAHARPSPGPLVGLKRLKLGPLIADPFAGKRIVKRRMPAISRDVLGPAR